MFVARHHDFIDRRDDEVTTFLRDLMSARNQVAQASAPTDGWPKALAAWGYPKSATQTIAGELCDLFWGTHQLVAVPGGATDAFRAECAKLGIDVVDLPSEPTPTPPSALKDFFGDIE